MKRYRVVGAEMVRHPVLRLTFDDGLMGEFDLSEYVDRGEYFAPLRDTVMFERVAIAENGRSFGWRLDELGREIDFCADAARADVETALVEERAARYRRLRTQAAE